MKKSQFESLIREVIRETIRKVDGKYVVYPEKGGKRLGTHTTKSAAEKQLTAIHLNKEAVEIKYTNPNFDAEWEEAVRYPEFNNMGKEQWIRKARIGGPIQYSQIKNVLGNVDLDFESLEEPKKQRFQAAFQKGVIEMPIAVKFSDDDYDLVAGNTRLSGLVKNGIDPKIWIVDLSDMQENYADDKEKEIVDDILSGLNEGTLSGVLGKMKQYAKKGLLTLTIVASVAQSLQAQGIAQKDIDAINQQGIELVQQTKSVDRNTKRILVQTLGQEKFDALVKLAKENDLLLGASKSTSLNIAKSSSRLNALSGINGEISTKVVDSKTYKTSDGQYLVIQFLKVTLKETVSNRIKHYQQKPPVDWEKRDWELYDENYADGKGKYIYIGTCMNSFDDYGECKHNAFFDEEHFFNSWAAADEISKEEFWSNIDPSSEKYQEVKKFEADPRYTPEYAYSKEDDIYYIFINDDTHYFFVNPDTLRENYADGKVEEGTGGADTAWIGSDNEKITLQDILNLTKDIKVINYPTQKLANIVLNWDDNPEEIERISQVEISSQYPILIMVDEQNRIQWILDGNHRAQKALRAKTRTIPAKLIKPSDLDAKAKKILLGITENYADGKVKGKSRPGRVKKAGASCKGSVTDLRAKAKKYGGEKGKMYHWCANMKSGRKKK